MKRLTKTNNCFQTCCKQICPLAAELTVCVALAHLLFVLVLIFILQAAAGVDAVREGGTLRVVLGAPETVFPQFVTFCTADKQNMQK